MKSPTKLESDSAEKLKDLRDYRETLIHKRNEIDNKISNVEALIKTVKESAK